MATESEQLILRGLHILMRANFSPNEPVAQARHFAGLQKDIGPWMNDYVGEMSKDLEPANGAAPN